MRPNKETKFKPIEELKNYTDNEKYFCSEIVFSPETENDHFQGCPPYIQITETNNYDKEINFEVPEIIAYYGKQHAGYTITGMNEQEKRGAEKLANKLKHLLDIQD